MTDHTKLYTPSSLCCYSVASPRFCSMCHFVHPNDRYLGKSVPFETDDLPKRVRTGVTETQDNVATNRFVSTSAALSCNIDK